MKKAVFLLIFLLFSTKSFALQGFTKEDRERLIRLETAIKVFMQQVDKRFEQIDKRFKEFREDVNKRFEQVDKRFEQIDKRFEQVDKRFTELRMDMNKRFEQVDKRFFELRMDINKRFEQVDKRFEQMMKFLWIISGIFTTLTATVIGFAYWDRRTIIRRAKEEAIEEIEKEGRLRDLIRALRKLSEEDRRLAEVLRSFGLL